MNETTTQEKILRGQCLNLASDILNNHDRYLNSDEKTNIKRLFDYADDIFSEAKARGYLK